MRLRPLRIAAWVALGCAWFALPAWAQQYNIPRIQGSVLLIEAFEPDRYLLTTENSALTLQKDEFNLGIGAAPSVSADGRIIAAARGVGNALGAPGRVLSIYSVKDAKWTDYPEVRGVWEVAISPDGAKVACVTKDWQIKPSIRLLFRLSVVDLGSGKISGVNESSDPPMGLSWSPDGRHIVFDAQAIGYHAGREIRKIDVLDTESGKMIQVGIGQAPSWSPSGDWIAYFSYDYAEPSERFPQGFYDGRYYDTSEVRISVMRPDGTYSRVVMGFHTYVVANLKPVWSPDSRALLVNVSRDPDNGTFDIRLVNLANHRSKKLFKNVAPVYGWAATK